MASGRARVEIQEVDLSTRVPSFPGVYAGLVIPARKGPVGTPLLVSYESELLKYFTPKGSVEVNDDLSFYSAIAFLENSNSLYVTRAANKPLYGGCTLKPDVPVDGLAVTVDASTDDLTVDSHVSRDLFYASLTTGSEVRVSGTSVPTGLLAGTTYYVIKLSEYKFMLAASAADAENGTPINITSAGTDVVVSVYPNEGSAMVNAGVEYGISYPRNYVFDTTSGKELNTTSEFTVDTNTDVFNVSSDFYNTVVTGDAFTLTAATFPTVSTGAAIDGSTTYYVIKADVNEVKLARTLADATAGIAVDLTSRGTTVVGTLSAKSHTSTVTPVLATDTFTTTAGFYAAVATGDTLRYTVVTSYPTVDDGDALDNSTDYYVIKGTTNTVGIARTLADANAGIAIGFSTAGVGTQTFTLQDKSNTSTFTTDLKSDDITISEDLYAVIRTGDQVNLSTLNTLPHYEFNGTVAQFQDSVNYYAIRSDVDNHIYLATSAYNASLGLYVDVLDGGVGTQYIRCTEANAQLLGIEQKCVLITGANEGTWNNDIYIETLHYPYGAKSTWLTDQEYLDAETVKEPGCFVIYVYQKMEDGTYTLVEQHTVSRDETKRDGNGNNVFIETVLEGSNYIRGYNNPMVDSSIYPINQTSKLQLVGGDDGFAVTSANMTYLMSPGTSPYYNKRDISVTMLLDGGYCVPAYQQAIISTCESRQDCVGILGVPLALEQHNEALQRVIDYRVKTLNANTSYAAMYSTHLKIQDKYNDRKIYVGADGYVASIISKTAANQEIWYAPAGPQRGVLKVLDVAKRWSDGEQDRLTDNGVNPIDFYPGKGIRVWGNRTLLSRNSYLSRFNVRLLLITIEPVFASFLEDFLFEFNDTTTRALVTSGIKSKTDAIEARRGGSYKVICNDENNSPSDIDNNQMNVDLYVKPPLAIEYIKFRVIVTRTSVQFSYIG